MIWLELNYSRERETTVARILAESQIWDMGRFAKRYRRIFGENPSETLNREARHA